MSAGRVSGAWTIPLLVAASGCSFIDRQILSLLVEPIKADLQLSDTGVSLLLGLAFVAIYAIAGPPLGWLIDRARRWRVVGAGVLAWSLFTTGGAIAGSYTHLFLMRMGVGIGEASPNPAAYSLISDTVPPAKRGFAIGLFGLGVYVGAGLALVIGGQVIGMLTAHGPFHLPLLGVIRPWQASFLVVGALGLPVALAAFLMPEPSDAARWRPRQRWPRSSGFSGSGGACWGASPLRGRWSSWRATALVLGSPRSWAALMDGRQCP